VQDGSLPGRQAGRQSDDSI